MQKLLERPEAEARQLTAIVQKKVIIEWQTQLTTALAVSGITSKFTTAAAGDNLTRTHAAKDRSGPACVEQAATRSAD